MASKIFLNLPVRDLEISKSFFARLGYRFNAQFTDEKAAAMVISEDIYAMLLTEPFFQSFIPNRQIADARTSTEVLICLSADSREDVDALVNKALDAGGSSPRPAQDHGFMYERSFADPDGHIWEIMWMDPAFVQQPAEAAAVEG